MSVQFYIARCAPNRTGLATGAAPWALARAVATRSLMADFAACVLTAAKWLAAGLLALPSRRTARHLALLFAALAALAAGVRARPTATAMAGVGTCVDTAS